MPSNSRPHSIDLALCSPKADFGQGFYLTTVQTQAEDWADRKFRNLPRKTKQLTHAVVLRFEVDRNHLASLLSLCFVTDSSSSDYRDFVEHCRNQMGTHLLYDNRNYDIVFGPITLWPQRLVIKDADQMSFHTEAALKILSGPVIHSEGTPTYHP
jgi:hypothetical protein